MAAADETIIMVPAPPASAAGVTSQDADIYRESFRAMPVVSFLTDTRAVILDATHAAIAFLNVAEEALLMKPLLYFVARQDTRAFRDFVRGLGERTEPFEGRLRPRHGLPCIMRLIAARVTARDAFVWVALPTGEVLPPPQGSASHECAAASS